VKVLREDGSVLIENLVVETGFRRYIGLMFRRGIPKDSAIMLSMDGADCIHSFFVFFSFRAVFLDKDFRVIEECVMKPFRIKRVKAKWVIEMNVEKRVRKGEKLIIR